MMQRFSTNTILVPSKILCPSVTCNIHPVKLKIVKVKVCVLPVLVEGLQ